MKVRVQLFGQLRAVAPVSELVMELATDSTVADLLGQIYEQTPKLRDWDKSILIGAGVEFVGRDHILQPNEQIAIMPPVQGG